MSKKKRRRQEKFVQEFFKRDVKRLGMLLQNFQGTFPRRKRDVQIERHLIVTITIKGDAWLSGPGGEMVLHNGVKDSLARLVKLYLEYRNPDYEFTVVVKKA